MNYKAIDLYLESFWLEISGDFHSEIAHKTERKLQLWNLKNGNLRMTISSNDEFYWCREEFESPTEAIEYYDNLVFEAEYFDCYELGINGTIVSVVLLSEVVDGVLLVIKRKRIPFYELQKGWLIVSLDWDRDESIIEGSGVDLYDDDAVVAHDPLTNECHIFPSYEEAIAQIDAIEWERSIPPGQIEIQLSPSY